MSNSLGAVEDPAELCPASSATSRFPDEKLHHLPAASSAAEDILASGDPSHYTPSKSGHFHWSGFSPFWKQVVPLTWAVVL